MKDHLIKKKTDNKFLSYTHKIILCVLISIFLYELVFLFDKDRFFYFNYEQINLILCIIYYLLCVIKEMNKINTKQLYQIYFHLCFSLSASVSIFYCIIYILKITHLKIDVLRTCFLLSPIIFNILETLIIKRYKPTYINPILIIIFLVLYYTCINFFGNMGMNIGEFDAENLKEYPFILRLGTVSIFGAFLGWWLYKVITKPTIKKIKLDSSIDSSELSET